MVLAPGSIIGIVGGGQLGRMMSLAAAELGYRVHIFTDAQDSPASHVSYQTTVASYTDSKAISEFAQCVDLVTFEFENIPARMMEEIAAHKPIHPSWHLLHIAQNRVREKEFLKKLGIPTAPFKAIESKEDLQLAVKQFDVPCLYKTAELGYDGKGQCKITEESNLDEVWERWSDHKGIVEAWVSFVKEISIIVCRNTVGEIRYFPVAENYHVDGILSKSIIPAGIDPVLEAKAQTIASEIAHELKLVGTLAVEFFVCKNGELLVNELAPRPHNSGHFTIDACVTSQFEQHIRAICGLPLGDSSLASPAKMINLIGKEIEDWKHYMINPRAKIHIYGKAEAKDGRKMGHVTILKDF